MSSKRRQALRDFYNLPGSNSSSSTVSTTRKPSSSNTVSPVEETALDKVDPEFSYPNFDSNAYVSKFMEKATPAELLQRDKSLVASIQGLSVDHRSLVYNHYKHLLEASDAINSFCKNLNTLLPALNDAYQACPKPTRKNGNNDTYSAPQSFNGNEFSAP